MQAETLFGIKVDQRLKKIKGCWFFNVQQVALRGVPDRVGVINGQFFALELKVAKRARRAKLQEYVIDKINLAGGYAAFVYPENLDEIMEVLIGYSDQLKRRRR